MMLKFHYNTFLCDQPDLQARLTELGDEGWRLHTCEPVIMVGPTGASGLLQILVTMDMMEDIPEEVESETAPEGIAMKG